ncbi:hypothetical protein CFR79_15055 [Komagataeibacter saccharivorans]|nr:hypothetical protein CFR79_15055 [Komagataeibacter saccharivorans]
MFVSGNTSPCHHSLHLFAKTDESQQAGIVQKLSDQALTLHKYIPLYYLIIPSIISLINLFSHSFV